MRRDFVVWWRSLEVKEEKRTLPPPELKPPTPLPRSALARILSARSLHGDFATYHLTRGHEDATLNCSCGATKTPEHLFLCRRLPLRHKLYYFKGKMLNLDDLITTLEGEACYAAWIKETNYNPRSRPTDSPVH